MTHLRHGAHLGHFFRRFAGRTHFRARRLEADSGQRNGIPISATLRPLSLLFDSLVFRTEIAVVWLPSLLADLRRIPIHARRRFHSLSMSGG